MKTKTLKIKNYLIASLAQWLYNLPLSGEQSRQRTKFVELLWEQVRAIDQRRLEMVKSRAKLDTKGEPVIVEDEEGKKNFDIPEDERTKLELLYEEMLNEEFEISFDGNKAKIETIKEIILTTDFKFSGKTAELYQEWFDLFNDVD